MTFYYTDTAGADAEAIRLGIAYAVNLATSGQCALAVHTKRQLDAPIFTDVLGADTVRELKNDGRSIIKRTMFLMTERIDPRDFMRGPVVAVHINLKFLQNIARNRKATDLIYVPWLRDELRSVLSLYPGAQLIG